MAYKEDGGFHAICSNIKYNDDKMSKNVTASMYWFTYLFSRSNSKGCFTAQSDMLKEYCGLLDECYKEKNSEAPVKWKPHYDPEKIFLNKGHKKKKEADIITIHPKFKKFLSSLAEFLVEKAGNQSYINYRNFDVIKENLRLAIIERFGKDILDEDNEVFKFVLDSEQDRLEQAFPFKAKLNQLRIRDPYNSLAWILIFSLFPDIEDDDLKNIILVPFERGYSEDVIVPESLKFGMSSYNEQLIAASIEYKCSKDDIEARFEVFCNDNNGIKENFSKPESLLFIHLMLLKAHEKFSKSKNNYNRLTELIDNIDCAVSKIDFGNFLDNDRYLEGIQLLLLKADVYWKMSVFEKMYKLLIDIEQKLYANSDFTDRYIELFGITKRKQGIYYNRVMDFNEAVKSYSSSYFTFLPQKKCDRSKIMNNEGVLYRRWNRYDKAYLRYIEAYDSRKERTPYDPDSICMVCANITNTLSVMRRFEEAIKNVEFAYGYRKTKYFEGHKHLEVPYITTTINYAATYLLWGVSVAEDNESQYFIEAKKKFDEVRDMLEHLSMNPSNFMIYVNFYTQDGAYFYFTKKYDNSIIQLNKAINSFTQHRDICHISSNRLLAVVYLYKGKAEYAKGMLDESLNDIWEAYRIAYSLYKDSTDKSYYRYIFMVCNFHLGAIAALSDAGHRKTIYSYYTNEYGESQDADGFLLSSRDDMSLLMEDSPNISSEYRGINKAAFDPESLYINEFTEKYHNTGGTPSSEDLEYMGKRFIDFYIIMDRDD